MQKIIIGVGTAALLAFVPNTALAQRSTGKTAAGIGLIAAGAALLAIQPSQPTLPGLVSRDTVQDNSVQRFRTNHLTVRSALGAVVLRCEPFCIGDVDEAIRDAYVTGGAVGAVAVLDAIDENPWTLYSSVVSEPEEKEAWQIYSGLAMIGAGAIIATVWADAPAVVRDTQFTPTRGGLRVGSRIGW